MTGKAQSTLKLNWVDVEKAIDSLVQQIGLEQWDTIIAVSRGGLIPARILAGRLGVRNIVVWDARHGVLGSIEGQTLIVDDIADSGKTMKVAKFVFTAPTAVLVSKLGDSAFVDFAGMAVSVNTWVTFPWEGRDDRRGERQNDKR